jgi:mono/diheme cytochrome c family protein
MARLRMSKFLKTAAVLSLVFLGADAASAQKLNLGRTALPDEIKAWDIDIRPDGLGLPPGKGNVKDGEEIYLNQCASCHGQFGEGANRWPILAGGLRTLKSENPEKTVGSFWPYLSTVYDYIFRAMPYGNAQSLTPDQTYAIVAFLLNMNEIVPDDFVLSKENFGKVKLPNVAGFYDDDRETAEKIFWNKNPCMANCKKDATVLNRARVIDVTPDSKNAPKVD